MSNSPLISVVVPVYKTEKFLRACVESILAQTFADFEIVLVDDGSPDNCPKICDEFAGTDSRVKVVHQENRGLSQARISGIKNAAGTWIMFVDSDDMISETALESLVKFISDDADIVSGLFVRFGEDEMPNTKVDNSKATLTGTLSPQDYIHLFFCGEHATGSLNSKLIRKELLTDDVFDIPRKFVWGEDLFSVARIAKKMTKHFRIVDSLIYFYRFNFSSISFVPKLYCEKDIFSLLENLTGTLSAPPSIPENLLNEIRANLAINLFYNRMAVVGQKIDWARWGEIFSHLKNPNTRKRAIIRCCHRGNAFPLYLALFLRSPKKLWDYLQKQRKSTIIE